MVPNVGYNFTRPELLATALTHSSYANERDLGRAGCNERLEFLGDSVLGYLTAEYLYQKYPDKPEGELTKLRAELVCEGTLSHAARNLRLGEHMRFGRGEARSGGAARSSILADAFEATLAAIYLDGGIDHAREFVRTNIWRNFGGASFGVGAADYKTRLQEFVQRGGEHYPEYRITDEHGPEHEKVFVAEVIFNGAVQGTGSGRTKKEAEQAASRNAVERLGQLGQL